MKRSILLVAAALFLAERTHAQDTLSAKIAHGDQVFQYWCAACHGRGAGKGGSIALAYKYRGEKPGLLEERTDLTPDQVKYFVRHGVSVMPFFRRIEISDSDLDDLAAYLAQARPEKR